MQEHASRRPRLEPGKYHDAFFADSPTHFWDAAPVHGATRQVATESALRYPRHGEPLRGTGMSNTGQTLYRRARKVMPGGTQLLSKRPEMFLPEQWPTYFKSAKGAEIVDLDGRTYLDMSYCGIGATILGFADPDVDAAVKRAIDMGSMSTLNCPEDIELAELLVELHPWADMVRFGRAGGEAMAIAVRIARARTRRSVVAFCGYHGWQDWYLAANLSDEANLSAHLFPGIESIGVPCVARRTSSPARSS